MSSPLIASVQPSRAIEGGRVTIFGSGFVLNGSELPDVRFGSERARVVFASSSRLIALVPPGITDGGRVPVHVSGSNGVSVEIAARIATGLHQVDNPVFDRAGNLYVTYSGTRGLQVPVSIFRVRPNGTRESFASGIVNPTSVAIGPDGRLYASSRFEGRRLSAGRRRRGEAVCERSRCRLRDGVRIGWNALRRRSHRHHLQNRSKGTREQPSRRCRPVWRRSIWRLHPTARSMWLGRRWRPTMPCTAWIRAASSPSAARRSAVLRGWRSIETGRYMWPRHSPARAGSTGFRSNGQPELVLSGPGLVGLAFDANGGLVVCSNDNAYRLPPPPPQLS